MKISFSTWPYLLSLNHKQTTIASGDKTFQSQTSEALQRKSEKVPLQKILVNWKC